MTVMIRDGCNS